MILLSFHTSPIRSKGKMGVPFFMIELEGLRRTSEPYSPHRQHPKGIRINVDDLGQAQHDESRRAHVSAPDTHN